MRLRRVIALLGGGDEDTALLDQGMAVCKIHEARLDALFVRRNAASGGDFLGDAFSTYGMEAVLEALDDAAAEASSRAHAAFSKLADDAAPEFLGKFIEFIGTPRAALAAEARIADLLVVSKPAGRESHNQLNAIEAAACESGRPVLVLDPDQDRDGSFKRIVVGWDGSLEAARAVIGGMPLLQAADHVLLVRVGADADAAEQLADMAHYLSIHRVTTETRSVDREGQSVARALIDAAAEDKADLLVMGGFGAPGWQRSIGRDETTALLREAPAAILLAH